jgi:Lysyl oxidase
MSTFPPTLPKNGITNYLACLVLVFISQAIIAAPRDNVSSLFPVYNNNGLPDLTVEPQRFKSQMSIVDRYFAADSCDLDEGAVNAPGYRRLLRFDIVVLNMGDGDLVVGDRANPNNPYAQYFVYHSCHNHYHVKGFSNYQLVTLDDKVVVRGTKQGFCFQDDLKYSDNLSKGYNCDFQGITSGWGDWYYKQLGGQWIDITGVPEGNYKIRVTINSVDPNGHRIFNEGGTDGAGLYPNIIETLVHVPDPRNKVAIVP